AAQSGTCGSPPAIYRNPAPQWLKPPRRSASSCGSAASSRWNTWHRRNRSRTAAGMSADPRRTRARGAGATETRTPRKDDYIVAVFLREEIERLRRRLRLGQPPDVKRAQTRERVRRFGERQKLAAHPR